MTSHRRPARAGVFPPGPPPAPRAPRRSDRAEADVTPVAEPSQTPVSAAPPSGGGSLLLAVLFLIGCAVGGVLIAWFGLMPGAGS